MNTQHMWKCWNALPLVEMYLCFSCTNQVVMACNSQVLSIKSCIYSGHHGQDLFKKVLLSCSSDTPQSLPIIPHYQQKACDEQALIGWDQLIQGRLAYTWGTIIATYPHQQKYNAIEMTALTWGRKFVRLAYIWSGFENMASTKWRQALYHQATRFETYSRTIDGEYRSNAIFQFGYTASR